MVGHAICIGKCSPSSQCLMVLHRLQARLGGAAATQVKMLKAFRFLRAGQVQLTLKKTNIFSFQQEPSPVTSAFSKGQGPFRLPEANTPCYSKTACVFKVSQLF